MQSVPKKYNENVEQSKIIEPVPPYSETKVPNLFFKHKIQSTVINPESDIMANQSNVMHTNSQQPQSRKKNTHLKIKIPNESTKTSSIRHQLFPVLAANFGSLSLGLGLGYSAVLLPQINQDNLPDAYQPFTVNMEEGSWIAGVFGLGAVCGGLVSALLGSKYGRKMTLIFLSVPDIVGWILVASSQNLWMMLIGRFLTGVAMAGYASTIQIFVSEISQPKHRGWLAGLSLPITATGVLCMYVAGSLLPWHFAALVSTPIPLLMAIFLAPYWDSPYWYVGIGKDKFARQALEQYRSNDEDIDKELLLILHKSQEDTEIIPAAEGFIRLFTEKKYLKPFAILNTLFFFMILSGKFSIDFYAVDIINHFGGHMNEYVSAVIIAFICLIGSIIFIPLVQKFSRKILLIFSSSIMAICLIILGICMFGHHHPSMFSLSRCYWLPMLSTVLYMLAAPIGLCSIPFIYIAEFFPAEMRSLMAGLTITLANLELFIVVKTFPNLELAMGDHGVFWLYAAACFLAIIFTLSYIPETKDKHLTKVEGKFAKLGKVQQASPWITPVPSPSVGSVRKLHFKTHLFTK